MSVEVARARPSVRIRVPARWGRRGWWELCHWPRSDHGAGGGVAYWRAPRATVDATAHTPSLWNDTLPDAQRCSFEPLPGDAEFDVVIVGAGLTGAWTGYYLAAADPTLRIAVLERATVGFGASGRNGGWCSALLPMSLSTVGRRHGRDAARALQLAMHDTVDEVGRVVAAESIDCHYAKGGTIDLARSSPQVERIRAELAEYAEYGFGADDYRWLDADEARRHCAATNVRGALFTPHCAVVHPARLIHGVAAAAARRGVRFFERTAVERIEPRRVTTARGVVRCDVVVRATEAYTTQFADRHRDLIPIYSLMIATEPLDDEQWASIGLADRPTFADGRHVIIYGQRTADGRLAFGGRGAPYHWGSADHPVVRHRSTRPRSARRQPVRPVPLDQRRRASRITGVVRSACHATGTARSRSTAPPGSPRPAATSVTASRRPTSPAARSPT